MNRTLGDILREGGEGEEGDAESAAIGQGGGIYHALNRRSLQATIYCGEAGYLAVAQIFHGALEIDQVQLFSYQRMPNHVHLVPRPHVDGELAG